MANYYILSVESFQDTFSIIDASEKFTFKMETQNNKSIMENIEQGDCLLVYRRAPYSGINMYLQVTSKNDKKLELQKRLEVSKFVRTKNENVEEENLVKVDEEAFNKICMEMISGIVKDSDEKDTENLKEQFENYIVNVLNLKSTRQVRDLGNLSQSLIEAGVIEKDVYYISDVDEYRKIVKKIKESEEYQNYKAERKSKSPNSGLASDQGMTNYEKFLIYISKKNNVYANRITGAENILLYGVPGVGKSHEIHEKYCNDESKMERVVFHPDYTYSDFVGQILPRVEDEKLKYVFTPGPFTKMLKKAWENPEEKYYLVIEEINRGNAPAIFGEIFQLLDRKTEDNPKYDSKEYGESEYAISNYDVAEVVFGDENQEIRIPSNMWILATMNTADQNVFTLDTAFQRRWNMHHMKNNVLSAGHSKERIEGSQIEWGIFASVINDMVTDINIDMASSEDKRLGAYFVKKNELSVNKFPEKVLKYLWDDAFKMEKEAVFDEKFKSLENVIETYEESSTDKLKSVLNLEVYRKMLNKMQQTDNTQNK